MKTENPRDNNNFFQTIYSRQEHFSKRQRDIAEYIIQNAKEIPFLTSQEFAERIGVSPSTVVRTVIKLGFKSFPSLKEAIRNQIMETTVSPLRRLRSSFDNTDERCEKILEKVVSANAENIRSMFTSHLSRNFCLAATMLVKAKRTFILGLRSSRGIAVYLHSLLHQFAKDIFLLDPCGSDDLVEHLLDLSPEDVFISIISAGPRYSKRSEQAVSYAHEHNIPCVLITNDMSIRPASLADVVLLAPQNTPFYSVVTFMTIVDALVLEIGRREKNRSQEKLEKAGSLLLNYGISV